ncbi:MAG TPA: hypothetical protein VN253_11730, partial [Kofleriaceae bacterium]|nr:hypothetical protein [Kofleriaceae bacterium]
MAVDSKPGATTILGAATPNGNATSLNGAASLAKRRRPSSLMKGASSLPTVEHSLEEFIAKANQTLVNASTWAQADQQAREEEAKRREQDQQRWKQAELQARESEAREASLRRQLDGLQGKLAEAEARAAVALSASASGNIAQVVATEATLAELKAQLDEAQQRARSTEEKAQRLAADLASARSDSPARPAIAGDAAPSDADADADAGAGADERVRIAEAKA